MSLIYLFFLFLFVVNSFPLIHLKFLCTPCQFVRLQGLSVVRNTLCLLSFAFSLPVLCGRSGGICFSSIYCSVQNRARIRVRLIVFQFFCLFFRGLRSKQPYFEQKETDAQGEVGSVRHSSVLAGFLQPAGSGLQWGSSFSDAVPLWVLYPEEFTVLFFFPNSNVQHARTSMHRREN